jgi:hypothetical protein
VLPAQAPPRTTLEAALEQIKLYGDLRLRQEKSFDMEGAPDRDRSRLRLRFGVNYSLSDELLVGARLVTGDPDDPNSPHVTLGDAFDGMDFSLDRAFATWRPAEVEGTFVTGGKFDHPFQRNPVYGELVWDADVQPEGVVFGRDFGDLGVLDSLRFTAGGYALVERSSGEDAWLWVAELSGSSRLREATTARASVAYYGYDDPTPDGSTALLADNAGNATIDLDADGAPDAFAADFGVLDAVASLTHDGGAWPVTLSAEHIRNLRSEVGSDAGWAAGLALGKAALPGEWRAYYQWQVVEREAVFSAFAQDDFLLATNHESHVLGVQLQVSRDVGLHLWALVSSPEETTVRDDEQWRVRLDLNIKF